ncbi:hypothetical protein FBU31_002224 [Coemansia sp. 'formosensis']|nr:hypothetical protein FBU31_002224 [Coemansia sp. 'formosensis']
MENSLTERILGSIEQLMMTQEVLLGCIKAPGQVTPVTIDHGVDTNSPPVSRIDSIIEPLTDTRLDEIEQDVGAFKSTWESLCEKYSPARSRFAPRSSPRTTHERETELDDDIKAEEVYSQAATMAAYGVEQFRKMISSPQNVNGKMEQLEGLLIVLCATLINTRDKHRAALDKATRANSASFRHRRTIDSSSESDKRGLVLDESVEQQIVKREIPHRDKAEHSELLLTRRDSGIDQGKFDMRHLQSRSYAANSCQQQTRRYSRGQSSSSTAKRDGSIADHSSMGPYHLRKGDTTMGERSCLYNKAAGLGRREIIWDAFLRQGKSESDVAAYFEKFTEHERQL